MAKMPMLGHVSQLQGAHQNIVVLTPCEACRLDHFQYISYLGRLEQMGAHLRE